MARKHEVVCAPAGCERDAGKYFMIREWPAMRADEWATRFILALTNASRPLPFPVEALLGRGMEAIFVVGLQTILTSQINPEVLLPLLKQLLECVTMIRDPKAINRETGEPVESAITSDDDLEEVRTIWWLRSEVLRVHTGFSAADAGNRLLSSILTVTSPEPVSANM